MNQSANLYSPILDPALWSGRADALPGEYLYQIIKFLDLTTAIDSTEKQTGYALLGFESDAGISRNLGNPGARDGPAAFRRSAAKLPIHADLTCYDAGNVRCVAGDLDAAQRELKIRVANILSRGLMPIVIGGGHETAWGHFQGLAHHYPHDDIAVLNFDAHFDLRPLIEGKLGSSGTPFRQIGDYLKQKNKPFHYYCAGIQPYSNTKSLFNYAAATHVNYVLADAIHANPYDLSLIEEVMNAHQHIYVTVCLDVFNAAIAPGVSAPQPLGIAATYVLEALRMLARSGKVISLDIVELAPNYDVNHVTAKLAASLFMAYVSCSPQSRPPQLV